MFVFVLVMMTIALVEWFSSCWIYASSTGTTSAPTCAWLANQHPRKLASLVVEDDVLLVLQKHGPNCCIVVVGDELV